MSTPLGFGRRLFFVQKHFEKALCSGGTDRQDG